uniref:Protein-serine/threonine kinase n=1 Tax=Ditylum brightwellii TaxID=49249 RepID=A0A7S4VKG9_9STRA
MTLGLTISHGFKHQTYRVLPAASSLCCIPPSSSSSSSSSSPNNKMARRGMVSRAKKVQMNSTLPDDVAALVQKHAMQPQTSASLQTLMKTGRGELLSKTYKEESLSETFHTKTATKRILLQVASFLRRELPIRLAHRIQDLDCVPLMRDMPSVIKVKDIYAQSLLTLSSMPKIHTSAQEEDFANSLETLYQRHSNVLIQMAKGAFELRAAVRDGQIKHARTKTSGALHFEQMEECHDFLDRFYMSRVGIRVLAGQYLALRQPPLENYIGMICHQTSPLEIVRHAVDDASMMCCRKFGDAPEVIISGRLDLTFPYIPTHLHYILLELLKNAMRATVEHHGVDNHYPPVRVIIADGNENEDVVIKVADEGGGIPRSHVKKIWSYLFTTANPSIQESMMTFSGDVDHSVDSPLAGLGYGLPISRSYARYFGGDVSIMSMEGYGTDAFVYLTRMGRSREPLPV